MLLLSRIRQGMATKLVIKIYNFVWFIVAVGLVFGLWGKLTQTYRKLYNEPELIKTYIRGFWAG